MIVDRRRQGISCVCNELSKMHVSFKVTGDNLLIDSPSNGLIRYDRVKQTYIMENTRRIGTGMVSLLAKCM